MGDQLVEVRKYLGRQEAEVAKAMLLGCGIRAEVFADTEGNMAPHLAMVTSVRLLVPASARDDALALLADSDHSRDDLARSAEEQAGHRTDGDSAAELEEMEHAKAVHRVYAAAVFGAVILPVVLQLYSLYLAREPISNWEKLTGSLRTKLVVALLADVAVLGFALWLALKLSL